MSDVIEGEEWKRAKETGPTRAEEQARVDSQYALGVIKRPEWRRRTDELSNLEIWRAEGRVEA